MVTIAASDHKVGWLVNKVGFSDPESPKVTMSRNVVARFGPCLRYNAR